MKRKNCIKWNKRPNIKVKFRLCCILGSMSTYCFRCPCIPWGGIVKNTSFVLGTEFVDCFFNAVHCDLFLLQESPYSPQDSPRKLKSENMTLRDDNQRLELQVRQLTGKLETLESSFEGIMSTEKMKVWNFNNWVLSLTFSLVSATFVRDIQCKTDSNIYRLVQVL